MAVRLDDYLKNLPVKRRRHIDDRAAELIAEEAILRQKECEPLQGGVVTKSRVAQVAVSEPENRIDK